MELYRKTTPQVVWFRDVPVRMTFCAYVWGVQLNYPVKSVGSRRVWEGFVKTIHDSRLVLAYSRKNSTTFRDGSATVLVLTSSQLRNNKHNDGCKVL